MIVILAESIPKADATDAEGRRIETASFKMSSLHQKPAITLSPNLPSI